MPFVPVQSQSHCQHIVKGHRGLSCVRVRDDAQINGNAYQCRGETFRCRILHVQVEGGLTGSPPPPPPPQAEVTNIKVMHKRVWIKNRFMFCPHRVAAERLGIRSTRPRLNS